MVAGVHPQVQKGDGGNQPLTSASAWSGITLSSFLSVFCMQLPSAGRIASSSESNWFSVTEFVKADTFSVQHASLASKQIFHHTRGQINLLISTLELLLTFIGVHRSFSVGDATRLAGCREMGDTGKGRDWIMGPHYILLILGLLLLY